MCGWIRKQHENFLLLTRTTMSLAKRNSEAAAKWAAKRRESQERALLQERSTSTSRRSTQGQNPPPSRYRASVSHQTNAEYMEEFREGMANMYLALDGPGGAPKEPKRNARSSTHLSASGTGTGTGSYSARHAQHGGGTESGTPGGCLLAEELKRDAAVGGGVASSGWRHGPQDPAGKVRSACVNRVNNTHDVLFSQLQGVPIYSSYVDQFQHHFLVFVLPAPSCGALNCSSWT